MTKPDQLSQPEKPNYPASYGVDYHQYGISPDLDFSKYVAQLLTGWRWLAVSLMVFLMLAALYIVKTPKLYTATATIQVEDQDQGKIGTSYQPGQDAQGGSEKLNTIVEKLQSLPLQVNVLVQAGLVSSNVVPLLCPSASMTPDSSSPPSPLLSLPEALAMVKKSGVAITAKLRRNTRLIDVTVTAENPTQAARVANLMLAGYLEQDFKIRSITGRSQADFLKQENLRLADKLRFSELALQGYREQIGTVIVGAPDNGGPAPSGDISAYQQKLSDMHAQVIQFQSAYEGSLAMGTNSDGLLAYPQISSDPQVQQLQTAIALKQADLLQLKEQYREKNPKYVVAVNTLGNLKQQLQEVVLAIRSRIQESLRLPYLNAQTEAAGLEQQLARTEVKSLELARKSIQYNLLAREAASDQALFNSALEKLKAIAANSEVVPVNISMVSAAVPPAIPSSPKVRLSLLAAGVLGLGFGGFVVLLQARLKNNLGSVAEAELFLNVPVLGCQYDLKIQKKPNHEKILFDRSSPDPVGLEFLRSLVANITITPITAKSESLESPRVLLFSSTIPQEGKTFLVANVAAGLARQGLRTIVVDMDLHKPTLDSYFQNRATASPTGISDVFLKKCSLAEVVQPHSQINNLWWVPAGAPLANVFEFLAGDRFDNILAELLKDYDRVLIDTPPLGLIKDALYYAKCASTVVLAVDSTRTNRHQLNQTIQAFQKINAPLIGVVLNFVPRPKFSSDYYDYYHPKGALCTT